MSAPQVALSSSEPTYAPGAPVEITATITGQNTTTTSDQFDLSGPDTADGTETIQGTETHIDPDTLEASAVDAAGTTWPQQSATQQGQVLTAVFTGTARASAQPVTVTGTDPSTGESSTAQISLVIGTPGLVGATTFAPGYPGARGSQFAAAGIFDGYIGVPLAFTKQKWYLAEGQYLTAVPQVWAQLAEAGCKLMLSVKPLRSGVLNAAVAASERANLQAVIKLLRPYEVILFNEFNDPDSKGNPQFGGAAQPSYADYVQTYAPAIADTGATLVVDVDISYVSQAVAGLASLGSLGPQYFAKGYGDWYGDHYLKGQFPDQAPKASGSSASVFSIFDTWGIPAGLGEWGMAAGTTVLTDAQWEAFTSYLLAMMQGRLAAGKTNADVCYYSGQVAGGPSDVSGSSDPKVSAIYATYQQLSAQALAA